MNVGAGEGPRIIGASEEDPSGRLDTLEHASVGAAPARLGRQEAGASTATGVWASHQEFHPEYSGYLTTTEGPHMADAELDAVRDRILRAQKVT